MTNDELDIMNRVCEVAGITSTRPFYEDKGLKLSLFKGVRNGTEVVVKIIPSFEEKRVGNYKREKAACDFLAHHLSRYTITRILEIGDIEGYFWLVREFHEVDSLSHYFSTSMGLFGYDEIQDKFMPQMKNILQGVHNFITDLQKVEFQHDHYPDFDRTRFEKDLSLCHPNHLEAGFGIQLDKQLLFYDQHSEAYYAPELLGYSISDMVPANIIVNNTNEIIFSDFEWFSYDHKCTDIVFLWLYLWKFPDLQKYWYDLAFEGKIGEEIFRCSIIRHCICWYRNLYNPEREITEKLVANRKLWRNHIWTKYLIAAGESFEALMKVK